MGAGIDFKADSLLAASPNPYVLLDRDGRIVWMNEAYLRTTMRRREDLVGRSLLEAFPADPHSEGYRRLKESLARVLATGEPDEIALIRYPIARPDGTMDERFWSASHTPLRNENDEVMRILQHTVDVTELQRTLRDEAVIVERAREVEQRNQRAALQLERLRSMVEQAPGFVLILSGGNHRIELANAAARSMVGERELVGRTIREALPEVADQGFVTLLDTVFASGKEYSGKNVAVALRNAPGSAEEKRYVDFIYQPITARDGHVIGIFVQGHDVTDQVRADQQQRLLINELNHRVKNTLSIVQGLAMQSFRALRGGEAYAVFTRRLEALAAAHSLLTARNWEAAQLFDVLHNALEAAAGTDAVRCTVSGEDTELGAQPALAMAMLIHELATNAIKYGALSTPAGGVTITTRVERSPGEAMLTLEWREHGGPPVTPPERRGFGTRLIERGIANHAKADVKLDFAPTGLVCTVKAGVV